MFTSKGVLTPKNWLRIVWGLVQVMVAGVLLMSGGLAALQTISILAAFPFMVLMIFMAISLLKSLRDEQRQIELHEALTRGRIMRLLEENDKRQADQIDEEGPARSKLEDHESG